MSFVKDYRDHVGTRDGKHFKSTLFRGDRLLLGLNCLEAGQSQPAHHHVDQDKFYLVQDGQGDFSVGGANFRAGPGLVVWAPSGVQHGVSNPGPERLTLLVGIAPAPAEPT